MADEGASLEGWAPEVSGAAALADVIDRAFDYRGDVTIVLGDGREVVGYVFNRDRDAAEPYLQLFEPDDSTPVTIPYATIRAIRFTGRDAAAGKSYAAWRERKAAKLGEHA